MKDYEYEKLSTELKDIRDAVQTGENSALSDVVIRLTQVASRLLNELAYTSDRVDVLGRFIAKAEPKKAEGRG